MNINTNVNTKKKLNHYLYIRINFEDYEYLQKRAKDQGKSLSKYVREILLED